MLFSDFAKIFGCLVGIKDEITAITLVTFGTSQIDLFASRIAAISDPSADNSIGNVVAANAIGVFLGRYENILHIYFYSLLYLIFVTHIYTYLCVQVWGSRGWWLPYIGNTMIQSRALKLAPERLFFRYLCFFAFSDMIC